MFERISYTWNIMGASWTVLKKDKELLLYTLLSSVCCLLVVASFAIPIMGLESWAPPGEEATPLAQVAYYGTLFLFYFCNYFVITFFNAAIVASTIKRLGGGDPTFKDGLAYAAGCLPQIFGWALLSATVGVVLRFIEDRSEKVGQLVAGLLGMAWAVVTFLVVPVLVVEKKGPVESLRRSTALLKQTWGESLVGHYSFGFVFFLLALPGIALIVLGVALGTPAVYVCVGGAVLYFITLALIESTLHAIFRAVIYAYAETGTVPDSFGENLLRGAMAPRR